MKGWLRLTRAIGVMVVVWLLGIAFAAPQAAPPAAQGMSDQVFKNVRVLKGIPVDDFMGTMGIMCAALVLTARIVIPGPAPRKSIGPPIRQKRGRRAGRS